MAMQKIFAREILDSRGNPTVEVDLHTAKGNPGPLLSGRGLTRTPMPASTPGPYPLLPPGIFQPHWGVGRSLKLLGSELSPQHFAGGWDSDVAVIPGS